MKVMRFFGNCPAGPALIALLAIACTTARINAQGYGTIKGTVSDPTGAVISTATVTALQIQTGTTMTTKAEGDGNYVFPSLLPSKYTISVSAPGFENYSQTGVTLEADQTLSINIHLSVGSQTQTVSVSADAPQVDTTTGTLSQVIDQSAVADMPLNGRAAASLITLVAGVVDATNEGNGVNQGSGKTFSGSLLSPVQVASVNGTLPNQDNFLLDGGNNLDEMTNVNDPYPMPDAIQEFSVQTSNYNAEFGQSAGAVVNIVTKSGGEQFHGDAFEYLRNGFFNAENHFSPAGTQDTLHRHQFGGTIGGPVKIGAPLERQDDSILLRISTHTDPLGLHSEYVHVSHRRRGRPLHQFHRRSLRGLQQPLYRHIQWGRPLQHRQPANLQPIYGRCVSQQPHSQRRF